MTPLEEIQAYVANARHEIPFGVDIREFTLKFTDENRNRHLDLSKDLVWTTRGKPKGQFGDVTRIDGRIYMLQEISAVPLEWLIKDPKYMFWYMEGFKSNDEYIAELKRIYGDDEDKVMYIHFLRLIKMKGE
jgi:hypothetical protein